MTTGTTHSIHQHHTHIHGPDCGHSAVEHVGHVDYLDDGHLHADSARHRQNRFAPGLRTKTGRCD